MSWCMVLIPWNATGGELLNSNVCSAGHFVSRGQDAKKRGNKGKKDDLAESFVLNYFTMRESITSS